MNFAERICAKSIFSAVAGAVLLATACPQAFGDTYDLASDWSIAANPNGAWTYGEMDTSLNFTPFTGTFDAAAYGDFVGPQPAWDGGYPSSLGKSNGNCIHDFPLDRVGGHTYNENERYVAIRWTAPSAGNIDISGGLWMFREIGRRDLVSLYINGVALFDDVLIPSRSAGCNSGATFSLSAAMISDGHSASELLQISVLAGDTVTLAVRKTADSDYGDYVGRDLTINLSSGNQAPLATDDAYTMTRGTTLTAMDGTSNTLVLANDTDPDGDSLSVELISGPLHASAFQFDSDGSFVYTPVTTYVGQDTFTYRAFDGAAWSEPATVRISIISAGDQLAVFGNGLIGGGGGAKILPRFSLNARRTTNGVEGQFSFHDRENGIDVNSMSIQSLTVTDTTSPSVVLTGTYTFADGSVRFVKVTVTDGGPGGSNDIIAILIGLLDGTPVYQAAGPLRSGNITIRNG